MYRRDPRRHGRTDPRPVHHALSVHHHARAGHQRHPHLEQRGVEGVRRVHQHRVARADGPVTLSDEPGDAAVRHRHALGHPGRTGGVHHVRQVLRAHPDRRVLRGTCGHGRPRTGVVQHHDAAAHAGRHRGPGAPGAQHGRRRRVGQHDRHPLRRVRGVHRHVRRARLPDAEQRHQQPGRPLHQHGDPAAACHPLADQVRGQASRFRVQLRVRQ